ncbi:DUF3231 family protein [Cohnella laeviribosi]|jgi:hypothetical protein|uniref:DUF3231 family protein n=1 Tax=Cohnella laeviribosi TaxID=380174 RepID=UPI00037FE22A|nr:DUF3231 family protein [Cohnella laeviribosi]
MGILSGNPKDEPLHYGEACDIWQFSMAAIMGKSIREDVAALFAKYHTTKAAIGLKILRLTKEKGWLVPPPLHIKKPEEVPV